MEMYIWLALMVLFILVEAGTAGLTTIWFAGGALVAFLAALLGAHLVVQVILFVLVSLLLLIFTRPLVKKYLNGRTLKTNADSLIGRTAVVSEEISNLRATGAIMVDGMSWTARSETEEAIPAGAEVRIREIRGVKCIVEKTAEEEKTC